MWGREPCERSHDLHLRAGVCGLKVTEQRTPPAHTHPARGTRRARSAVGAPGTAPRGRLIRPLARPLIVASDHHAGPPRRPRSLSAALLDRLDRPGAEVPRCAPLAPPQPQEGHSSLSPNGRRIALSVAGARTAACVPAARAAMTASGSVATAARGSERDRPRRRRGSAGEASQRALPAAPAAEGAPRLLALARARRRPAPWRSLDGDGTRGAVYPRVRAAGSVARLCTRRRAAAPRLLPPWQRCGGGEGDRPKARRTHACSLPYSRRRHTRRCVLASPGGGLGGVCDL